MHKKCLKHPKYKGKGVPKNECVTCLELYLFVHNKPRFGVQPSKVFKDKKKYNRRAQKQVIKKYD